MEFVFRCLWKCHLLCTAITSVKISQNVLLCKFFIHDISAGLFLHLHFAISRFHAFFFKETWKNGAIKAQKNFFLPHGLQWLCTKICFWFVNVVLVFRCSSWKSFGLHCNILVFRGGVEDTRLEAKGPKKSEAKGTKKIRGQGQTLSRPRTGMLEVKPKDQGHNAEVI